MRINHFYVFFSDLHTSRPSYLKVQLQTSKRVFFLYFIKLEPSASLLLRWRQRATRTQMSSRCKDLVAAVRWRRRPLLPSCHLTITPTPPCPPRLVLYSFHQPWSGSEPTYIIVTGENPYIFTLSCVTSYKARLVLLKQVSSPKYSGMGAAPCGQRSDFSGQHQRHHPVHHHHHHLLHHHPCLPDPSMSATLPRRNPLAPAALQSRCASIVDLPQITFLDTEAVGPSPRPYITTDKKRVSFASPVNFEEDAPSTPLLRKSDSSV